MKQAAEKHAGVKCESFGFGKDRRVHLFKTEPSQELLVRNTFIDGFAEKRPEALFSTAPTELPTLLRRRHALPETLEEPVSPKIFLQTGEWLFPADEPQQRLSVKDLVGKPPGLRSPDASKLPVRNTFIEVKVAAEDRRAVQSLPHGMFRRQLLAEALAEPAELAKATELATGSEVIIVGLVKLPAFNGQRASVESFDAATGRYNVLLSASIAGVPRQAKVKRENLVPVCEPAQPR